MKTTISEEIIRELKRHNQINKYIVEQGAPTEPETPPTPDEVTPPTPDDATLGGVTPSPAEPTTEPGQPIDIANDPDVEELTDEPNDTVNDTVSDTESGTEELDITELVNSQKNIENKQEEFMGSIMGKLDDLEQKLAQMDNIFQKINDIESKVEKYRPKSAEEKLQLRSLDSYPFNQKLTDFFDEKSEEMEKTGKNQYVLTTDDVEDVDGRQIRKTFDQAIGT